MCCQDVIWYMNLLCQTQWVHCELVHIHELGLSMHQPCMDIKYENTTYGNLHKYKINFLLENQSFHLNSNNIMIMIIIAFNGLESRL